MKVNHFLLIGFALLLAPLFLVQAQIPRTLSYQGVLTDPAGNIKPDGPYTFTFRLYDVSSGGTALWTETETNTVKDGLFSTTLGDQTAFPASLAFDKPYWLSIEVESEELSPRIALLSVPYSLKAARADTTLIVISPEEAPYGSLIKAQYLKVINPNGTAGNFTSEGGGSDALRVYNNGSGNAAQFTQGNPSSSTPAVNILNNGMGEALYLVTNENTNNDPVIYATTTGTGSAGWFVIDNSSNSSNAFTASTDGTGKAGKFQIYNYSSSASALEAGTNGTGYAGYFSGDIYIIGSYLGSDIRWKRNIAPIDGALMKVLSLQGVRFEWNRGEYPNKGFREGQQIGFIAQELEEVLPELVREDQDGYKAIDYPKVTAVLVEAIKEQQAVVEDQQATIDELSNRVALLESKMNMLAAATMESEESEGEKVAEAGEHRFPAINKLLRSYLK